MKNLQARSELTAADLLFVHARVYRAAHDNLALLDPPRLSEGRVLGGFSMRGERRARRVPRQRGAGVAFWYLGPTHFRDQQKHREIVETVRDDCSRQLLAKPEQTDGALVVLIGDVDRVC